LRKAKWATLGAALIGLAAGGPDFGGPRADDLARIKTDYVLKSRVEPGAAPANREKLQARIGKKAQRSIGKSPDATPSAALYRNTPTPSRAIGEDANQAFALLACARPPLCSRLAA
jgi:hypothetical protein